MLVKGIYVGVPTTEHWLSYYGLFTQRAGVLLCLSGYHLSYFTGSWKPNCFLPAVIILEVEDFHHTYSLLHFLSLLPAFQNPKFLNETGRDV